MHIDSRLQTQLDREDFRMRRLRMRAYGLRINQTPAEIAIYPHLTAANYQFQVPLLDYIVDFLNPVLGIIVEIDGGYHTAQPRKDANRMWNLYQQCGVCTIRFVNEEVLKDTQSCLRQIKQFEQAPLTPQPWVESEGEIERKQARQKELKEIVKRLSQLESSLMGKTRKEAFEFFQQLKEQDSTDQEVLTRLYAKLIYWPEDGYVSPGLQRITADKNERKLPVEIGR